MEFSQRLYELRRKAGLSQEELANLVGVTRQAVQKWESGASKPDLDNIAALADYFQVTLDYLISGREPEPAGQAHNTTVINHYYGRHLFEYRSKRTLFGLPLVHINYGFGFRWARGIIAIGNISTGLVALGGLSAGLLSLGGVSLGLLLALGGLAVGGAAVGGFALGVLALGGITMGLVSIGGVANGMFALGGVASAGKVAIGGVASAPVAIGAAVEGAQTFLVPESGGLTGDQLERALAAIRAACQGAPGWVADLLCFFTSNF